MSTWVGMGFTPRQTYGLCISPDMIFYTNPTGATVPGAGPHRGVAMSNPSLVYTMPSPLGMCNGSGETVFAQNYNGAGIYKSLTGAAGTWASVTPASGSYPAYGVAYNIATDTLYQTGRFGGAGPTDCFRSIAGGAWANITGLNNINMTSLCVNNGGDGSVYIGIAGAPGPTTGIWKQTAGSGSFVKQTIAADVLALGASPSGNVYAWAGDNLYKQTAGVGDFSLATGITNPTFPASNTSALAFDKYGNLYVGQGGGILDVLKISLEDEALPIQYSYNLYWSYVGGNAALPPDQIVGTQVSDAISPYEHMPVDAGWSYYYVITAVNDLTLAESIASNEVSAIPLLPDRTDGQVIW